MLRENFNKGWQFLKDESSLVNEVMGISPGEPVLVDLPHDAMVLEEREEKNPSKNAGGFYPGGNYKYEKTFRIEKSCEFEKYFIEFEGIYEQARVYINNNFVCSNKSGYRGFYADITPYIIDGEENKMTVKVTNGNMPNSRWYTGSGIYRSVNILKGNQTRVGLDGLKITTPDVDTEISLVSTQIRIDNDYGRTRRILVKTNIIDDENNIVATEISPITLLAVESQIVYQRIYVTSCKLWSPDSPNLYRCEVKLLYNECVIDEAYSTFGIRRIQVDPVHGLRINGETTLLRGSCIHHDNGVLGAATYLDAEERRVRISKKAGFNALRIAHNSASKALLDACDKYGMLVIDESFDTWNHSKTTYDYALNFLDNWVLDVEAIVQKDYNHPSVIMYSIGNEIQELGTPVGARWNRQIANKFRELDASRFVTNGINGLLTIMDNMMPVMLDLGMISQEQLDLMSSGEAQTNGSQDINDMMTQLMGQMNYLTSHHSVRDNLEEACSGLDISGYNYMRDSYKKDTEHFPNRIIYGSETLPPDIDLNWKCCQELDAILGDFTWTGWDYIGEAGVGIVGYDGVSGFLFPYPAYLAYVGDIDITGYRRPMSYYREIVFGLRKEPYISVQFPEHYSDTASKTPWVEEESIDSWTWMGYEGKPIKVEVYSDADEIELFCNNKSLGRKPIGPLHRFKALYDTTYEVGLLEAVAYRNGEEAEKYQLRSAEKATDIKIRVDKEKISRDDQTLAFIEIELVDSKGRKNPNEEKSLEIKIEGPIKLLGYGSGDPLSKENFYDTVRTTYNGRLLAVISAANQMGVGTIKVSGEGINSTETHIQVR